MKYLTRFLETRDSYRGQPTKPTKGGPARSGPPSSGPEIQDSLVAGAYETYRTPSGPGWTLDELVRSALADGVVERSGLLELARDVCGVHDREQVVAAVALVGGVGVVDVDGVRCWALPRHVPRRKPATTWPADAPSFEGVTLDQIRESREAAAGWGPNRPGA